VTPTAGGLRADPNAGMSVETRAIIDAVIEGAIDQGFDPMTALAVVAIESDFDLDARNPHSSAGGLFQFIDSTWDGAGGPEFPNGGGKGNGHASFAPLEMQIEFGIAHLIGVREGLVHNNISAPTPTAIYMGHQQGLGGALKVLKAAPGDRIEDVVGTQAAALNGFGGMTVQQTRGRFKTMVQTHLDEVRGMVTDDASGGGGTAPAPAPVPAMAGKRPRAIKAASEAQREQARFARMNGAVVTEDAEPLHARGLEYFDFVGAPRATIVGSANPWSAAFISFVMHLGGMTSDQFPFSPNHARYILKALANRDAGLAAPGLSYFEISEFAPRVGDLVGAGRLGQGGSTSVIRSHLPDRFFTSHTDIVVDTKPGRVTTIGGNVNQTIGTKSFRSDNDGFIEAGQEPFFVIAVNV